MIALAVVLVVTAFVSLLLLAVPIAFVVAIAASLGLLAASEIDVGATIAQRMAAGVDSFPLLAIPLFILAGNVMSAGGTADRLIDAAKALVGRLPGGLSVVNVVSCMLFGSISGSAGAAISSIGSVTIPALEEDGESRAYATALCTTAATTGLLIPPSNVMIVYAVVAQTSVAALFFAGIGPGLLLGVMIIATALVVRRFGNSRGAPRSVDTRPASPTARLDAAALALPSLSLIAVVLGGILGGAFSATEAAAIAVLFAVMIGCVERLVKAVRHEEGPKLTFASVPRVLVTSTTTTAIVMFLIASSQALSWVLSYLRVPQEFAEQLIAITDNPIALLTLINLALLAVGTVFDMTPAVLIFAPIFLPVAETIGLDPVHFGVVMVLNLSVGLCTPPVGNCLFIGCSVGRESLTTVSRAMIPFYCAMLAALTVTTAVPAVSTWLPRSLDLLDDRNRLTETTEAMP